MVTGIDPKYSMAETPRSVVGHVMVRANDVPIYSVSDFESVFKEAKKRNASYMSILFRKDTNIFVGVSID